MTLKPGSSGKKVCLFADVESLYVWLKSLESGECAPVGEREELVLEPGGFIEAELAGFEYAHEEDGKFYRLNFVRVGKASPSKNASGLVVSKHVGWVTDGLLLLRAYSDLDVDVIELQLGDSKINLDIDDDEDEP